MLTERAELKRKADEARGRFAAEPDYKSATPAFREADAAVKALAAKEDELDRARDEQRAMLALLSSESRGTTKAAGMGDLTAPGAWMAESIRRNKALTTDDVGSVTDLGRVFIDTLSERAAILAAGPTVVDCTTTSIRLPILTGRMAPATPVPELAEILETTPPAGCGRCRAGEVRAARAALN